MLWIENGSLSTFSVKSFKDILKAVKRSIVPVMLHLVGREAASTLTRSVSFHLRRYKWLVIRLPLSRSLQRRSDQHRHSICRGGGSSRGIRWLCGSNRTSVRACHFLSCFWSQPDFRGVYLTGQNCLGNL